MAVRPSEDERKRSDKDGRRWCQCSYCKRWFKHANSDVRVCGALLSPPEARCLLRDDFGASCWSGPMPDLEELQRLDQR
jgi:hypothetical protein